MDVSGFVLPEVHGRHLQRRFDELLHGMEGAQHAVLRNEHDPVGNLHELPEQREVPRPLRHHRGPLAPGSAEKLAGAVGQQAGDAGGDVEHLVLLPLVLVELQVTQPLFQNFATRALGHGLLHERAYVVAPQRRHPDDVRIAGLVGEQARFSIKICNFKH